MKKTTINISYDEEKLSALKIYLAQKGSQVEDELTKELDTLYSKNVPANVREFIELRSGGTPVPAKQKAQRPQTQRFKSSVSEVSVNESH
ncbi:MAG: DUF6103 family protein [Eubacteriales bacterium]|nr:DUF6103 family protein [Eubacteriales bacterium]